MSLYALKDGTAHNIGEHAQTPAYFHASLHTHLQPEQYGDLVSFYKRCEDPVYDVSGKSALAQVGVNFRALNGKDLTDLKYRGDILSVPAVIALESAYARLHFQSILSRALKGEDVGRLYVYDRATALTVDEVDEMYVLPKNAKQLSKTEIALPLEDVHYVIKEDELEDPEFALLYALEGRSALKHVLRPTHGNMPELRARDALIGGISLNSRTDVVPPTNIVLATKTTRAKIDHLSALLLDQGRKDEHHGSSHQHSMCFQVELANHSDMTLSPEEVMQTYVKASFYKSAHLADIRKARHAQDEAVI